MLSTSLLIALGSVEAARNANDVVRGGEILPAGTAIRVRLAEPISSEINRSGDRIDMLLDENLVADGRTAAQKGDLVVGRITEVEDHAGNDGDARLSLTLDELRSGGQVYTLQTNRIELRAGGDEVKDIAIIGGGAGLGAVLGSIIGGGKGAAIGAAIGAGLGTTVVLVTPGDEVEFEREQPFQFYLQEPVRMAAHSRNDRDFDRGRSPSTFELRRIADNLANETGRFWAGLINLPFREDEFETRRLEDLYLGAGDLRNSTELLSAMADRFQTTDRLAGTVRKVIERAEQVDPMVERNRYLMPRLQNQWQEVENQVIRLAALYDMDYAGSPFFGRPDQSNNYLHWEGRVSGAEYVVVRGDSAITRRRYGDPIRNVSYRFGSPLPERDTYVTVQKIQGRGKIEVVEQPSRSNGYSAVVQVTDSPAGSDFYEFRLVW